ncbi:proline-rich protein [Mycena olivaceomarginata]|nr:proline-rich protein [Mycena olivaceomarginata]
MWTLTAPFDGDTIDVVPDEKTKLLKPNTDYPVARQAVVLSLHMKKISRGPVDSGKPEQAYHGNFTVGNFTEEDVVDPTSRPTLNYTNNYTNTNTKNSKIASLKRGDEVHSVNPGQTFELLDGDILAIATRVSITVRWHPLCFYQRPAGEESNELLTSCAALGIHLVHLPGQHITHHLTDSFAATTSQALSLVSSAAFVNSGWLKEIARLGDLPLHSDPSTGLSLEQTFKLPPIITKYRPTFDEGLPSEQQAFKIWEPNEERMNMFSSYRFICVGEAKRQIDSEMRELLTRASGKIEVFDVKGGAEKWRGAISRAKAKAKQNLVPIADEEACEAAIGKDGWKKIAETTRVFGLGFFSHKDIIQAVINADASVFSAPDLPDAGSPPSSSPLPDVIPNTLPDEGSLVPEPEEPKPDTPPPRKLTRRVSSRQASQEPKPDDDAPAPRRHLTRRAGAAGLPMITGLDDPSILLNSLLAMSSVVAQPAAADPSVRDCASKPRARLKRRVGQSAPAENVETLISNAIMSGVEPETGEEPPLKKFKALFDASDPRRSGAETYVQESGAFDEDDLMLMDTIGSQTQQDSQDGGTRSTRSGRSAAALRAVPEEEEEESQMPVDSAPTDAGKKRKERSFDGDDVEMAGVEEALNVASGSGNGPAAKKRAVQGNAVERVAPKPPSVATQPANVDAAGAASGKPDTDDAFLKAIASTKRGKKTEDDTDRDFNKLKISKSNLRGEDVDQRPEWELLESFGDESNLVGNFMVIQELEVFKVDKRPEKRAVGTDPRWEGKPDFKKFKKAWRVLIHPNPVELLIISDENDTGGLGPEYWKTGNSQDHSDNDFGPTQARKTQPAKKTAPGPSRSKAKSQAMIIDSEEEAEIAPKEKAKRSKPPSKAEPAKKRTTRGASKAPETPAALFLDSDSDVKPSIMDDDFDGGQTLQSSAEAAGPARRSTRPAASRKKAAPIIVDDDSDDGAVFTGFGKRKARR